MDSMQMYNVCIVHTLCIRSSEARESHDLAHPGGGGYMT